MIKLMCPLSITTLTVSLALAGCATVSTNSAERYQQAVADAAEATPEEIIPQLVPIVPDNKNLVWRDKAGVQQVKMVTWTSWDGYDDLVGQDYTTTREIWVTSVPEVHKFCRELPYSEARLTARLEQLLGLPPDSGQGRRFVEMWVTPADLFRPCPDSEITDNVCGLVFPVSHYMPVSADYRQWFEDLKATSYQQPDGYPWTRLGYTYDWGHPSPLGASEFIVPADVTVEIDRTVSSMQYCR